MLHPFMPFITEELWQHIYDRNNGESIMRAELKLDAPTEDDNNIANAIESVKQIAKGVNGGGYCTACFDGDYPTEIPKAPMKNRFETKISENKENGNE